MKKPAAAKPKPKTTAHKPAKPAKPAKPLHPAKRAAVAAKKAATRKKTAAAAARKRKHSPDELVAMCTVRAFAETLRLSGRGPVGDSALLDVYSLTAGSDDAGASITATAAVILEHGLGGRFPSSVTALGTSAEPFLAQRRARLSQGRTLILGLDLPDAQPHAVAVDAEGGWWSWGEPFDPAEWPGLIIEECWEVHWS